MNFIVCVKEVPDTESRIEVRDGKVVEEGLQYVLNPYDEYALEEALKWQEAVGGKVTLVSLGPERARESILKGLAMGADEAYQVVDDAFPPGDAYATAQVLAAAIRKLGEYDAVFCGKQAIDDDGAAVGVMLAELLNLPHVGVVTKLTLAEDGQSARAEREIEGGKEVVETSLPAVFTAQKGLNEPRYPSFKGIRQARTKPFTLWGGADIDLGDVHPGLELVEVLPPPERPAGRVIPGEPAEAAAEVARLLRAEAKVI
ncbi:MAG: electron transfer flavoprotein subunit beta/FixA family protein [Chloroflexi bacterium]|nr:electron transfer flavoprotein subunit beta/FixA family protein [Chloroflexota bacterium]MBU1749325.1 electron transfer flavoprotein subunit beta/FixA family protein [Chloroflexota bacterium]